MDANETKVFAVYEINRTPENMQCGHRTDPRERDVGRPAQDPREHNRGSEQP